MKPRRSRRAPSCSWDPSTRTYCIPQLYVAGRVGGRRPRGHRGPSGRRAAVLLAQPRSERERGAETAGVPDFSIPPLTWCRFRKCASGLSSSSIGRWSHDLFRHRSGKTFPYSTKWCTGMCPSCIWTAAATSQKPTQVIAAIEEYYRSYNANVHRAIHVLGERATGKRTREPGRKWPASSGAPSPEQYRVHEKCHGKPSTWWRMRGLGRHLLKEGDVVVTTPMEHHSNIVPWQLLDQADGVKLKFVEMTEDGRLRRGVVAGAHRAGSGLASSAVTQCSNVAGHH